MKDQEENSGLLTIIRITLVLLGAYTFLPYASPSLINLPLMISCEQINCEDATCNLGFLNTLQDIHNANKYERTGYNCLNYSRDYVKQLQFDGYKARVVTGPLEKGSESRHAWVELTLYIDPTSGLIITPNEKYFIEDKHNDG